MKIWKHTALLPGRILPINCSPPGSNGFLSAVLATDYCVFNTVKDGLALKFQVCLLLDAIKGVNVNPDDSKEHEEEMRAHGGSSCDPGRHRRMNSGGASVLLDRRLPIDHGQGLPRPGHGSDRGF